MFARLLPRTRRHFRAITAVGTVINTLVLLGGALRYFHDQSEAVAALCAIISAFGAIMCGVSLMFLSGPADYEAEVERVSTQSPRFYGVAFTITGVAVAVVMLLFA